MNRYSQICDIVARVRPASLVEVGTHKAKRALMMCRVALRYSPRVTYVGYDVFEHAGEGFQRAALNGKGTAQEAQVRKALHGLERSFPDRFSWQLVVGDTRKTLAGRLILADLVFIDGDHRVETIRSDYAAVASSRCVIFDDYYVPGAKGGLPDLAVYGANAVVDEIEGVQVLPTTDQVKMGWGIRLAMVANEWPTPMSIDAKRLSLE